MTAPAAPSRPFFLPALGLVVVFALLGPAIGGAVFIPLAMLLEAQTQAAAHIGWIAGLIGHALALIPAYILGLMPAACAGLAFALYDAWAPVRAPRALGAALIGAAMAHGLYLWLMWAGAAIGGWIVYDFGDSVGDVVYDWTSGEVDSALYQALIASGAFSAFACASVAALIGLTTRA
ncbi:MAG: hypothetical protein KGM15_08265 [Pseudomonadota bacterium]|nr:hypothetical protein [Pseudomonadota bacterium]